MTNKERKEYNPDLNINEKYEIRTKFAILELFDLIKDKVPQELEQLFATVIENLQFPESLSSKNFRINHFSSKLKKTRDKRSSANNRKESDKEDNDKKNSTSLRGEGKGTISESQLQRFSRDDKTGKYSSSTLSKGTARSASPSNFRNRSSVLFGGFGSTNSLSSKENDRNTNTEISKENEKNDKRDSSGLSSNDKHYEVPILPKPFGSDNFHFFDLNSLEIARQLCLSTQSLFKKIDKKEWILWNTKLKMISCKNLTKLVENFNDLTRWACTYIVTGFYTKQRAYYMMHVIAIAHFSLTLNNYHASMALLVALRFPAINRLKKSWKFVESKYTSMLAEIQEVCID
jgi:hypothetical protein